MLHLFFPFLRSFFPRDVFSLLSSTTYGPDRQPCLCTLGGYGWGPFGFVNSTNAHTKVYGLFKNQLIIDVCISIRNFYRDKHAKEQTQGRDMMTTDRLEETLCK